MPIVHNTDNPDIPVTDFYIDEQVVALRDLHQETLQCDRGSTRIREFLTQQANTLREAHVQGNDAAVFHFACWCRPLIGKSAVEIMNYPLSMDLITESVALEHGYRHWVEVEALGDTLFAGDFEQAVDLVLSGEKGALSEVLTNSPSLAKQTSQFGHAATLLHYVAANGVESHRQVVPLNAGEIVDTLLRAGADVNAEANIYGGGSRVLGLLMSSAHPRNAGICAELRHILVAAGAN